MAVYFAEACGYIKIGFSTNPLGRVGSITRLGKRPADIPESAHADLLGWVPGGRDEEKAMHARFADRRVDGEWFSIDPTEIVTLLWDDPRGYDFVGMTFHVGMTSLDHPELTRDDMERSGVRIAAYTADEQRQKMRDLMAGQTALSARPEPAA